MDKETKIKEEVQKTLHALESIKNIEGNPFLFTRIKAAVESPAVYRKKSSGLLEHTKLSFSLFALLLLLNVISVFFFISGNKTTETGREELITSFAQEYSLVVDKDYLNIKIIKE